MVDQPVGERGTAERVQARADDRADLERVELERVDRVDRVAQQVLLDLLGASLQRFSQEVLAEVQVAALDAAAREDALGELVALQPQPLQHLLLREDAPRGRETAIAAMRVPARRSAARVAGSGSTRIDPPVPRFEPLCTVETPCLPVDVL